MKVIRAKTKDGSKIATNSPLTHKHLLDHDGQHWKDPHTPFVCSREHWLAGKDWNLVLKEQIKTLPLTTDN